MNNTKECEICHANGDWFKHSGMFMCPECRDKEIELNKTNDMNAQSRVDDMNLSVLERQLQIDQSIQIRADVFNAATVSIVEMKAAINADQSIPEHKKNLELGRRLKDRHIHLKDVIFERNQELVAAQSEQRSIQQYINTLVNKLRKEEQEELKIQDINYKPIPPKTIKVRQPRVKKRSFDKKELAIQASKAGIDSFTLQTVCIANNMNPEQAVELINKMKSTQ